ncbi:hypothetical protein GCM10009552_04040 [Rothia nasimurium]|uniref:Uncharacterized protein n=1 Tax=Luteibacter anthropi TaxID=564369 RepID=A0A7X5UCF3_9GAMM|nr:hypothetical protein [Luteibacter anthropi]NII07906.1 hypothetical protein [Luteibacter anthropi]
MASIFTGLAVLHGHIVDRELLFRLARTETRPAATEKPDKALKECPCPEPAAPLCPSCVPGTC